MPENLSPEQEAANWKAPETGTMRTSAGPNALEFANPTTNQEQAANNESSTPQENTVGFLLNDIDTTIKYLQENPKGTYEGREIDNTLIAKDLEKQRDILQSLDLDKNMSSDEAINRVVTALVDNMGNNGLLDEGKSYNIGGKEISQYDFASGVQDLTRSFTELRATESGRENTVGFLLNDIDTTIKYLQENPKGTYEGREIDNTLMAKHLQREKDILQSLDLDKGMSYDEAINRVVMSLVDNMGDNGLLDEGKSLNVGGKEVPQFEFVSEAQTLVRRLTQRTEQTETGTTRTGTGPNALEFASPTTQQEQATNNESTEEELEEGTAGYLYEDLGKAVEEIQQDETNRDGINKELMTNGINLQRNIISELSNRIYEKARRANHPIQPNKLSYLELDNELQDMIDNTPTDRENTLTIFGQRVSNYDFLTEAGLLQRRLKRLD